MTLFAWIILALLVARWAFELWLAAKNERYVRAQADAVPEPLREIIDAPTYRRSVDYTLAKSRFGKLSETCGVLVLIVVLFSGVLPWALGEWGARMGETVWAMAAFLFVVGLLLSLPGVPFDWYAQFKLEERFGFNTTTLRIWLLDRVKGLLLAALLGFPLLALLLRVIGWAGASWWLWAWVVVIAFQLLLLLIAPALIMPLFNKFTPLADAALRARLFALAQRTGFPTRSIDVMDGSKRSRHSNAFFTGFGRLRKIVLFDTLVAQLSGPELEAVLAHEIGHCKKRHIVKLLGVSVLGLFLAFAALGWLARQDWFYRAFGFAPLENFAPSALVPALLLFAFLAGTVSFWLTPLLNLWSRRFEYEADAYARAVMGGAQPLVGALRKLSEKNLSNLTPHPLYSGFYYSHPTLLERECALNE